MSNGPVGSAALDPRGAVRVAHPEVRVDLEQHGVGELLVVLHEVDRVLDELERLGVVAHRVHQHLGRVEHRLDERVVGRDRLSIVIERQLGVSLRSVDVTDEVVGLGRLGVELEALLSGEERSGEIPARDEIPTPIQVGRELVHGPSAVTPHRHLARKVRLGPPESRSVVRSVVAGGSKHLRAASATLPG